MVVMCIRILPWPPALSATTSLIGPTHTFIRSGCRRISEPGPGRADRCRVNRVDHFLLRTRISERRRGKLNSMSKKAQRHASRAVGFEGPASDASILRARGGSLLRVDCAYALLFLHFLATYYTYVFLVKNDVTKDIICLRRLG